MLEQDLERFYVVYPSWAQFSFQWNELRTILSNPLESRYNRWLAERRTDWQALGYPIPVQPFDLLDGAAGNGIIVAHIRPRDPWLPFAILRLEANLLPPAAMSCVDVGFKVWFMEPMDGFRFLAEGRRSQKSYLCPISAEHAESAGDDIFWLVGLKRGSRTNKLFSEVDRVAQGFGLRAELLPSCPEQLVDETADWFKNQDYVYFWYKISSTTYRAGFHFAVVIYLGLHLRWRVGSSMSFMHLVAQIPGKPTVRKFKKHW